jgi:radical SAM enzyme (TIGR01210 family)
MVLMISDAAERPLACWPGKERHRGEVLDSLTVIFKTTGCSYNRCLMCSYRHERLDTSRSPLSPADSLLAQLAWVLDRHPPDRYTIVKFFTSGSFFDPGEVPPHVLQKIAEAFRGKIIIAETRPEYVQETTITPFMEGIDNGTFATPLYCAIGLETTNDLIREKCIRKGFSFRDFTEACSRARKAGAGIKAYLLHKPLFLTEKEALTDMHSSIRTVARWADMISMNPCTVQGRTEMERYWKQRAYRPPYLWSVLSILGSAPVHVTCDPVGGGRVRGPHNCGRCDYDIVAGIRDYSLTGDKDLIAALLETDCPCREEWQFVLDNEKPFMMPLTR